MNQAEIIIIGAGASGLAAARLLSEHNRKVLVLEARQRPGGRIHTITDANFSTTIEGGAEFIHGNLEHTLSLTHEAKVKLHRLSGKNWQIKHGEVYQDQSFIDDWDLLIKKVKTVHSDITVSEFIHTHLPDDKYTGLRQSLVAFVEGYDAADIEKVSLFSLKEEWLGNEEEDQYRIDGGYIALIDLLIKRSVEAGAVLHFGCAVKEIEWKKDSILIRTADGNEFRSEKILISVPISLLQSGDLHFSPSIDRHMAAAQHFGFGGVIKFIFEFHNRFWEMESDAGAGRVFPNMHFLFTDALIPTWWTQLPSMQPILTGWIGGPKSLQVGNTETDLFLTAVKTLSSLFRLREDELKKMIKAWRTIDWNRDEWSKGAYAYATLRTSAGKKTLNAPIEETIFFCGEALNEGSIGTVEAALSSGKRAGTRLLQHLRSR